MKKSNILATMLSVSSLTLVLPFAALAAMDQDVFDVLSYIINATLVALIGIATLIFMYGVIQYVIAKGDEKQLATGRTYMLYGIIGLVAMVAVWGFVNLIIATIFGVGNTGALSTPDVTPLNNATRRTTSGTQVCIFGVCF